MILAVYYKNKISILTYVVTNSDPYETKIKSNLIIFTEEGIFGSTYQYYLTDFLNPSKT